MGRTTNLIRPPGGDDLLLGCVTHLQRAAKKEAHSGHMNLLAASKTHGCPFAPAA